MGIIKVGGGEGGGGIKPDPNPAFHYKIYDNPRCLGGGREGEGEGGTGRELSSSKNSERRIHGIAFCASIREENQVTPEPDPPFHDT